LSRADKAAYRPSNRSIDTAENPAQFHGHERLAAFLQRPLWVNCDLFQLLNYVCLRKAGRPEFNRFTHMTYEVDWVKNFDWMEWSKGVETRMLLQDQASPAHATADQLSNVIVTIARSDLFAKAR
jgi:hypothetical protein